MRKIRCVFITIFLILLLLSTTGLVLADNNKEDHGFNAIIARDGHIKSPDYDLREGDEIRIDVTVKSGGPIDVYLMTSSQYFSAYSSYNQTRIAISYLKGIENIRSADFKFKVPDHSSDDSYDPFYDFLEEIYVIIDNRNCSLTPNDADSIGTVEVTVFIEIDRSPSSIDEFNQAAGICVVVVIIIIVLIIALAIYFYQRSVQREKALAEERRAEIKRQDAAIRAQWLKQWERAQEQQARAYHEKETEPTRPVQPPEPLEPPQAPAYPTQYSYYPGYYPSYYPGYSPGYYSSYYTWNSPWYSQQQSPPPQQPTSPPMDELESEPAVPKKLKKQKIQKVKKSKQTEPKKLEKFGES